ncbi:PfkB family carbohydrate kinase [Massilibacteroides sp.]|uniref:PfkB family carbohydrate kinase n=1 Tax=Massilibacteroides sp. TaxID=2034766 RepID=UPI002628875E|nr:PfkB family carbohydrate kinase [Massilibacteroides sp.]MDD4514193.1 PfkB family carbohydrate kinase [Massilibacteroides sp.]
MDAHQLCCVGHITLDKVVTPRNTIHMPGGTAYYFSHAIRRFGDIDYTLVTALAESEMGVVDELRNMHVDVAVMPSKHSVYFENIYGENQDNRKQRVLAKADPFSVDYLEQVNANIYHLGSLLADDFSTDVIRYLAGKGKVSVDSQGYLREVRDEKVYAVDWPEKLDALKHIYFLKVNEHEMEVLTGYSDVEKAAKQLYDWGVKEVLITLGSMGSVIYDGRIFYFIPAYKPAEIVDATGCGDTYMTGYLYCRVKGETIEDSGCFAAAMSTLKIEASGPFKGTKAEVIQCMEKNEKRFPDRF